ncbi:MAG: cytoskeleton protein RodZ [Pseudohongiellaceae bacterium]|jgi:cytoskeleton protein RodZ
MTDQSNAENNVQENPDFAEQGLPDVGRLLNTERQRQGLTEKQVADDLHITMHYIRAIESNSFEKLPGNVFAKGYIKSYAMLLGMDVAPVMASYNAHIAKELDVAKEKTRIQVRRRKDKNRPWVIASVVLFVTLFVGLWLVNYSSNESESEPEAAIIPTAQPTALPIVQPIPQPIPQTTAEIRPGSALESAVFSSATTPQTSIPTGQALSDMGQAQPDIDNPEDSQQFVVSEEGVSLVEGATLTAEVLNDAAQTSLPATQPVVAGFTSDAGVTGGGEILRVVAAQASNSDQIIYVEAVGEDVLLINFSGESWVEISDTSQGQIYRDLLVTGDRLEVKGTAPFDVLLGDAPFAELTLNGNTIDVSADIRVDNSARLTVGLE